MTGQLLARNRQASVVTGHIPTFSASYGERAREGLAGFPLLRPMIDRIGFHTSYFTVL